ncbi:MAG: dockerin type I domain-containing protein [Planctomycetota bacterium]
MNEHDSTPLGDDVELPDEMVQDLRALFAKRPEVDDEVDRSILTAAREHLHESIRHKPASRRLPIGGWVAAVASLAAIVALMAVWIDFNSESQPQVAVSPSEMTTEATTQIAADIDGNGSVNILDALTLARRLEQQQSLESRWDLNGDGTVDALDVRTIAESAVRLRT